MVDRAKENEMNNPNLPRFNLVIEILMVDRHHIWLRLLQRHKFQSRNRDSYG